MNKTFFTAAMSAVIGGVVAVALMSNAGCGSKGGEEIASVNGDSISVEDIHKHLETKGSFSVVVPESGGTVTARVAFTPAFQGLVDLVQRKIVGQMAKDEKLYPTDAELTKELEFQKKIDPNFIAARQSIGMNLEQIKDELRHDMCQYRIITKGVEVTEKEAEQFIKDNKQNFINPEELELYYILANSPETRKKVDQELASGNPFVSVAIRYSEAPSVRDDNARYNPRGKTYTQSLPPALKSHIQKTPETKRTGWIQTGTSALMFYVQKRIPARPMTVDSVLKERVRRSLAMDEGSKAVDIQKRILERLQTGKFKVSGAMSKMWENHLTELKRAIQAKNNTPAQ